MNSNPPPLDGYGWRAATLDDAAAMAAVLNAAHAADGVAERQSPETMRHELASPSVDLDRDSMVAIDDQDRLVGYAFVWLRPSEEALEHRAYLMLSIEPAHRGRGLEDRLTDWAIARGTLRVEALDDPGPRFLARWVDVTEEDDIRRFEARGFERVRYFWDMERPLGDEHPGPAPAGIDIVPWDSGRSEEIRLVHNEAFRDHWGSRPVSTDDWEHDLEGIGIRTELSFLARAGDRVVGYCIGEVYEEDWEAAGRSEAWVGVLGVLREYRKRGVASALMRRSFVAMEAAGFAYAMIGVDSESPSGAQRLYRDVGFTMVRRGVTLEREVR